MDYQANDISGIDYAKLNTVNNVFMQKKEYFIIALTGKVGSGCSDTAERMGKPTDDLLPSPPQPGMYGLESDMDREIRLVRRFYHDNAPRKFHLIKTREIITSFLLESPATWGRVAESYSQCIGESSGQKSLEDLLLNNHTPIQTQPDLNISSIDDAVNRIAEIVRTKAPENQNSHAFEKMRAFITQWLPEFSRRLHDILGNKYTSLFQQYGNEIRFYGTLDTSQHAAQWAKWYSDCESDSNLIHPDQHPIYSIAARINTFIKILRRDIHYSDPNDKKKVEIVKSPIPIIIDSIKNVYESNYLKDRYAAYYLMSISCDEEVRRNRLMRNPIKRYTTEMIDQIDFNERPGYSSKKLRPFLDTVSHFCARINSENWNTGSGTQPNPTDAESINKLKTYISNISIQPNDDQCYEKLIISKTFPLENSQYSKVRTLLMNEGITKALKKEGIVAELQNYYWEIITDPLRVFLYSSGLFPFFLQDVETCIQNADIFLADTEDERYKPRLNYQLMRYISLIIHPGLVPPTPVERCMQIAYAAKANSGCISRQVGAVTTDCNYNILSLGWNDVPCGETPCIYRNLLDLSRFIDKPAYSDYEYDANDVFQENLLKYEFTTPKVQARLNGLPACFCFKDINAEVMGEKNPMNARAMHGEEKALLTCDQQRIAGGFLFTTSSPCEMCAKNAKQHHIRKIYYIEPYPGISQKHCCSSGIESNRAEFVLFEGAIGRAYTQLYTPIIPYKDELSLRGFPKAFRKTQEGDPHA